MAAAKTIDSELSSSPTPSLKELAKQFFHYLTLQREVEERIERKLYRQGKVLGGVYVGRGQEAICVGSGLVARETDIFFPCHRDLALYFMRGITPGQVFAQYMGRSGGLTRGREGNMHMGDLSKRIVAIISAMAASIPVAAGAAMAEKYKGTDNVVFVYFGDGATSRGDWHEGINLAAVQKAPLVLICNNNAYAYSTPLEKQMACEHVADRAPGYGIPAEIVDGNDCFAVYEATQRAVEHARSGQGPYMLECKTFRMTGHSAHDGAFYVPKQLFEEWQAKDPILQIRQKAIANGWFSEAELDQMRTDLLVEIDAALEWADASPYPDPAELLHDVYEGSR